MFVTFYLSIVLFLLSLLLASFTLKREIDTKKASSPLQKKLIVAGVFIACALGFGVYGVYDYHQTLTQERQRGFERLQGIEHLFRNELSRADISIFDTDNPRRHDLLGRLALYVSNSADVSYACLVNQKHPIGAYLLDRKSNYAKPLQECSSLELERTPKGFGALLLGELYAPWRFDSIIENRFDRIEARFFLDTRRLEGAVYDSFNSVGNLILGASILIFVFSFVLALRKERFEESVLGYSQGRAFDKIIESIPMPILYKNMEGSYLGCNSKFLELSGKSREEVIGFRVGDLLDKKSAMEIEECERHLKEKGECPSHDIRFVDYRGEECFIRVYKTLLTNNFDEPVGILGFFVDMSEYHQSQRELKERQEQLEFFSEQLEKQMEYEISGRLNSERRYKQLFDSGRDGIFVVQMDEEEGVAQIVEANWSAHEMFGYSQGAFEELAFASLVDKGEREGVERLLKELPLKGGALIESHFVLLDHRSIPIELSIQSFLLEEKRTLYVSARDITERLRLEEEKRVQENLLVQQSKMASMGEMIGAIAHQWKQPLNVIYLMCQGLKESFAYNELDEAEMDRFVSGAMKQVEFMSRTITDFRNFFMPSKEKCAFALKEALLEMHSILAPQFSKHDIEVRITQEGEGSVVAYGYPNEFKQVALNLMNNSRDAIEERILCGEKISGKIEVRISSEGDYACARIKDNGGGIPDEILKNIFEPYFSTKGEKGTGIGLSIAKMIIEKNMNGKIRAYNEEKGAVFEIRLPLSGARSNA